MWIDFVKDSEITRHALGVWSPSGKMHVHKTDAHLKVVCEKRELGSHSALFPQHLLTTNYETVTLLSSAPKNLLI
jgi:hypothetical protein